MTDERAAEQAAQARAAVNGRIYGCVHDGPYPCPDGEVVEVRTVALAELTDFLGEHPHCPDSVALVLPLLLGPIGT